MIRLTRTGKLFLAVLVLLYFASITSQSGLLLLLIGLLLGCFLLNFWTARQILLHVQVSAPVTTMIEEGGGSTTAWTVENSSKKAPGSFVVAGFGQTLATLTALEPSGKISVAPELGMLRRGVYSLKQVALRTNFPFGLLSIEENAGLNGELVVYPKLFTCEPPVVSGFDVMVGGKQNGHSQQATGFHFGGIRSMGPTDSFRQIHWKSSAKGQGWMVKTYDEELSGRAAVLLLRTDGTEEEWEDAIRAAGSLAFAGLDQGHHIEFWAAGFSAPVLVPPFNDGGELLGLLARLPEKPESFDVNKLNELLGERISRKSALNLVIAGNSRGVEEFLEERATEQRVAFYSTVSEESGSRRSRRLGKILRDGILT
ncbi:MAG: DUF58 domain-containing protein [Verrucomicrobiota bacterium]|nr:DUF58 domain-containing protein [Verrucomicrobiota bacterium]